MQSRIFTVSFKVPSTENHTIDAELLGKSLIDFHQALKIADKHVNGDESELDVRVRANKEGSFGVEYEVIQLLDNAIDIVGIIGLTGAAISGTVMGVMQQISSKKIKASIDLDDENNSVIILDDDEEIVCPQMMKDVVLDKTFRQKFDAAFWGPIAGVGNPTVELKNKQGDVIQTLSQTELNNLRKLPNSSLVEKVEQSKKVHLRLIQINFDKPSGWKAEYLNKPITFKMDDARFLNKVNEDQHNFKKGDLHEVTLKTIERTEQGNTASIRYIVTEVHRKVG